MKISYKWIKEYIKDLPAPEKVAEAIILHAFEVESIDKVGDLSAQAGDTVFDIKILPDRAHDCLSHFGIAKEISGILGLEIKEKESKIFELKPTELEIEVQDEKCLRYMGRIIKNIKVEPSPLWLKERLEAIGQKSINNIVDAANFVMFDLGQPIHSFDLDKLGSPKIIVRNAKNDEKITTLDKKEIKLDDSMLVIADEKDPLVIAGIKGGIKAEVDNSTRNIVIEVANFNPTTTRKTSKKINILTDAVKRYENEISPELCEKAMNDITDLVVKLAGGEVENIVDIYPDKQKERKISFSVDFINKKLGEKVSSSDIENILKKYEYQYKFDNKNFEIVVPTLRLDLNIPEDMVEEIGRAYGYEKISPEVPKIDFKPKTNETFYKILFARNKLLDDGYCEVMTYSFCNTGEVEVLASASDKKFLRTNLSDGLKESLKLNKLNSPFLGINEIKIFEIGTVFKKDKEEIHVAYSDKKNIVEKTLEEFFSENSSLEEHGYFSAEKFLVLASSRSQVSSKENSEKNKKLKMWSLFPFISRDIAVWTPEGEDPEQIRQILVENGTELLAKEPYMFDSFTKEGKTSYAFRLVFQSYDRTLTDEEINPIMTKISHKISENSSWQIR
ncbi:MAG: phenylalanine--tRNA ligase subunit beta [Minisyncoccia bacterium]